MLRKDRNRFKKIRATHEKTFATSIGADADSGDESEEGEAEEEEDEDEEEDEGVEEDEDEDEAEAEADDENNEDDNDNDNDDGSPQIALSKPTKTTTTKKSARARGKTAGSNSAARRSASPIIQDGTIVKRKGRRLHRRKEYGYRSAPSDSEWEVKRKVTREAAGTKPTLAKLRETIDRHSRYCPFVRINKKLHNAHRRIRVLQGRQFKEPELSADDDPGAGHANWRLHPEDSDDEDDDSDDGNQPDATNEDEPPAPQRNKKKAASKKPEASTAKNAAAKPKTTQTTTKPRKPAPKNKKQTTPVVQSDEGVAEGPDKNVPSSIIEDIAGETNNATAGATDMNAPTSQTVALNDQPLKKIHHGKSTYSGSDIVDVSSKDDVQRKQSDSNASKATSEDGASMSETIHVDDSVGGVNKKRKATDAGLARDVEPISKDRKIQK